MRVVLLTEHFTCILNGVCIWYLIYLAILTDHVTLLFTSTDTVLGLSRSLGVVMAIIILILEVICLIVVLLCLNLSRAISLGHIIPHHIRSRA